MTCFLLALLCISVLRRAEASPIYNLTHALHFDNDSRGYARYIAADPRQLARLLLSDGWSRIWELADVAVRTSPVLYAGTAAPGHQDGPRESAAFTKPRGLCVDSVGAVFVAEPASATVRRIDGRTGYVATVAGISGVKGDAQGQTGGSLLTNPTSVVCLQSGSVLVGDTGTGRLSRLDCAANCYSDTPTFNLTHMAQVDTAMTHGLWSHMVEDPNTPNRILISDGYSQIWEIQDVSKKASPRVFAGTTSPSHLDAPKRIAGFNKPHELCVDRQGAVFVAETASATVRRIDGKTGYVSTVAGVAGLKGDREGVLGDSLLNTPTSILCSVTDMTVLVGDPAARELNRLQCIAACEGDGPGQGGSVLLWRVTMWVLLGVSLAASAYMGTSAALSVYVKRRMERLRREHNADGDLDGTQQRLVNGAQEDDTVASLLLPRPGGTADEEAPVPPLTPGGGANAGVEDPELDTDLLGIGDGGGGGGGPDLPDITIDTGSGSGVGSLL